MNTDARTEIRTTFIEVGEAQFLKDNSRGDLNNMAAELDIDVSEAKTKGDVLALIIPGLKLPDPSLRGKSTIELPVSVVFQIADGMLAAARKAKGEFVQPRRKDIVAAAKDRGVAHFTARTQVQVWFTASHRGTKLLSEIPVTDLPKALQPAPVVEEAVTT